MTFQQVKDYYGDWRGFVKRTGMGRKTWFRWQQEDRVPFAAQKKLARLTRGRLKAEVA